MTDYEFEHRLGGLQDMNGGLRPTRWSHSLMHSELDGVYGKGKQMGNLENVFGILCQPGFLF